MVTHGTTSSVVLRIPYTDYNEAISYFWAWAPNFFNLLRDFIPNFANKMTGRQQKLMRMFNEFKFKAGSKILTEGQENIEYIYVIA